MSDLQKPSIFGVLIDDVTQKAMSSTIRDFLSSDRYHHIVTLNPEILLEAYRNDMYKNILNAAALRSIDGIGVFYALLIQRMKLQNRITGLDLMQMILTQADDRSGKVFLAANKRGLSKWRSVRDNLSVRYPHISFTGKDLDPQIFDHKLQDNSVDVVLCNFGAPEQEFFLHRLSDHHAKIGIGIGGAFDFITGAVPRAPRFMRTIGLEWLYRLYKQPQRWKRIYNAVIVFPYYVISKKK